MWYEERKRELWGGEWQGDWVSVFRLSGQGRAP